MENDLFAGVAGSTLSRAIAGSAAISMATRAGVDGPAALGRIAMAGPGFIDHIGVGVPDLAAAKRWYDQLMPMLGLRAWFPTTEAGEFNYGPDGARGTQIFFYRALEPDEHSRHATGLQHLSFMVASRGIVRETHEWAVAQGAEVVHAPREFPEYGAHYATYFLDPHGIMLEIVCHHPDEG
jgi:catechol 2,3-dioxygenase-like lactoylglutathione lyase family enzyme